MKVEANQIANGILKAIAIIVGVLLFLYFMYTIRSVLAYLAIAAVMALLGRPIVHFLTKKLKFPNTLAAIATMLVFVGILLGLVSLFIPLISEQGKSLSLLDINSLKNDVNTLYQQITAYFGAPGQDLNQLLRNTHFEQSILKDLNLSFIPNFLNSILGALGSISIGLFSVLFISFFFLKDSKLLQSGLLIFTPDQREGSLVTSINKINSMLSRYFVGILAQLSILFVIYMVTLLIVGVENAIVIAFLCALMNIIPYVGPIIGGALMVTLTMTSFLGQDFSSVILPKAGYVLLGILIGQMVDNFFSQPVIFSKSVKSHPLEIFLVIIIAGLLFGIVGMVVAVPGYTAIKVILKEFFTGNQFIEKFTKNV